MLKFLRQYNKWIVVVGGIFLMVVFLAPQAIQQIGASPADVTYARYTIDGDTTRVTRGDRELAGRELAVVGNITWQTPFGVASLANVLRIENAEHWLVLSDLAERAGLVGGPGDGQRFLQMMSEEQGAQVAAIEAQFSGQPQPSSESIAEAIGRASTEMSAGRQRTIGGRNSEEFVDTALAKAHGIFRLRQRGVPITQLTPQGTPIIIGQPLTASARESWDIAAESTDTAVVDVVIISADRLAPDSVQPTPGEIEDHFDRYAQVDPTQDPSGFGYLQPDAVRFEALILNADAIRQGIEIDPIEVNRTWRQRRDDFPGDFEQERRRVEGRLREEKAVGLIERASDFVKRAQLRSQLSLERDDAGYLVLPDDWSSTSPSLDELAESGNAQLTEDLADGVEPFEVSTFEDQWYTLGDLRLIRGGGTAAFSAGGAARGPMLPQVMMMTRELNTEPGAPARTVQIQQNVLAGPFAEPRGTRWWVRPTAVRPSGPPDSLEMVRSEVEQGARRELGYERLAESMSRFEALAELESGLEQLAFEDGAQRVDGVEVRRSGVNAPSNRQAAASLNVPAFRGAVIDAARAAADAEGNLDGAPSEALGVAVELPTSRAVVAARINSFRPLNEAQYRAPALSSQVSQRLALQYSIGSGFDESLLAQLDQQQLATLPVAGQDPFGYEALLERLSWDLDDRIERERGIDEELAAELDEDDAAQDSADDAESGR